MNREIKKEAKKKYNSLKKMNLKFLNFTVFMNKYMK